MFRDISEQSLKRKRGAVREERYPSHSINHLSSFSMIDTHKL
jgi:hypothetical protein